MHFHRIDLICTWWPCVQSRDHNRTNDSMQRTRTLAKARSRSDSTSLISVWTRASPPTTISCSLLWFCSRSLGPELGRDWKIRIGPTGARNQIQRCRIVRFSFLCCRKCRILCRDFDLERQALLFFPILLFRGARPAWLSACANTLRRSRNLLRRLGHLSIARTALLSN